MDCQIDSGLPFKGLLSLSKLLVKLFCAFLEAVLEMSNGAGKFITELLESPEFAFAVVVELLYRWQVVAHAISKGQLALQDDRSFHHF